MLDASGYRWNEKDDRSCLAFLRLFDNCTADRVSDISLFFFFEYQIDMLCLVIAVMCSCYCFSTLSQSIRSKSHGNTDASLIFLECS